MTKLQVGKGIWVDDFGVFDQDHTKWMRTAAFVKQVLERLQQTPLGSRFLAVFETAAQTLDAGPRYGHASLVIRPVDVSAGNQATRKMVALSETSSLTYRYEAIPRDAAAGADPAAAAHAPARPVAKTRVTTWSAPATTPPQARPAQIYLFPPNGRYVTAAYGSGVIDANGAFTLRGEHVPEQLSNVLVHEMVHAYHYVIGSQEPDFPWGIDADELRCVGLLLFRGYEFSENALRAALGSPLRLDYHGCGHDTDLAGHAGYFLSRRAWLDPKEFCSLRGDALMKKLRARNAEIGLLSAAMEHDITRTAAERPRRA